MSTMTNLATSISSMFMRGSLKTSKVSFSTADKDSREKLADDYDASEEAFKVTKHLVMRGFNAELDALNKAYNKVRSTFDQYTEHVERSASGAAAAGERWIPTKYLVSGEYKKAMDEVINAFWAQHARFVAAYPQLINDLEYASRQGGRQALGKVFDRSKFPSLDKVRDGFAVELTGPYPIADASAYRNMPASPEVREALEAYYEATLRRNTAVASQNVATDLAKYLKVMADNLAKLTEHRLKPKTPGNRAPSIHDTLVTNVTETLDKVKAFAIPDTDQGSKLMDLVDRIESTLNPASLDAELIKTMPPSYTQRIAEQAKSLASLVKEQDWDY